MDGRPHRRGKTGDYVVGRIAQRCSRAASKRWVTAEERGELERIAESRGLDQRLVRHLSPADRFEPEQDRDPYSMTVRWMDWVSSLPEPQRTSLIEAFEFYVAFGGDAEFPLDGRQG